MAEKTMRDPERISKILEELGVIWRKHPDMRLGQLIANAAHDTGAGVFYLEDEKLMRRMHDMFGDK